MTEGLDMALDAEQSRAVAMLLDEQVRFGVITGGPGRGKTTCLRSALVELRARNKSVALAAPTGKAARRMAAACGYPASTLHRLLGIGTDDASVEKLWQQVVIVDEASMLDTELGALLVDAIDPRFTRLFLVGDKDQLPSIGPGYVLGDLLASGLVPVVELKTLHRSAAESWIARNAPRVLAGDAQGLELGGASDFRWVPVEGGAERCADVLLGLLEDELGQAAQLSGARDMSGALEACQVLIPMKMGPLGVEAINARIQAAVQGDYIAAGNGFVRDDAVTFYSGDKVLQTKNDYQLQVMNGETGIVEALGADRTLLVRFDDREVSFTRSASWTLDLGFATTIHKAQGSEWPLCVVVCHSAHGRMLGRQLIYTALTRAKKRLVLIGDAPGLAQMLKNGRVAERSTGLGAHLAHAMGEA